MKEATARPSVDDTIELPFMGSDVRITVAYVLDFQPHLEHGVFRILDQYDEEHLVELDGGTWVTTTEDAMMAPPAPGM